MHIHYVYWYMYLVLVYVFGIGIGIGICIWYISYPQVHTCLLVSLHPHILLYSDSCVFGCNLTSSHPYVIFPGLRVFAYILVSSNHLHTLRLILTCWYPCIVILRFMCVSFYPCSLISSDSCVFPFIFDMLLNYK